MKYNELNEEYTLRLQNLLAENFEVMNAVQNNLLKDVPTEYVLIEALEQLTERNRDLEYALKKIEDLIKKVR